MILQFIDHLFKYNVHCYLFAWRYYPFFPILFLISHYVVTQTASEFLLTCKTDITPMELNLRVHAVIHLITEKPNSLERGGKGSENRCTYCYVSCASHFSAPTVLNPIMDTWER